MGKSSRPARRQGPVNDRQAKIRAAAASTSKGPNKIVIGTVVAVLAVIAIVVGAIWQQNSKTDSIPDGGKAVPAGTSMGAGFTAYADATLKAGAPTLDVFEDFQCPACKLFEDQMGATVASLAREGKVKAVYHIKTFLDDTLGNDSSMRAGIGALCAADAGKFEAFHDATYAGQPATEGEGWTDAQLHAFAQGAGITGTALTTWDECTKAKKYQNYLSDLEEATFKAGVKSTPTLKLNGTVLDLNTLVDSTGKAYDPAKLTAAITAATK